MRQDALHGPTYFFYLPQEQGEATVFEQQVVDVGEALNVEQHLLHEWLDSTAVETAVPVMSADVWQYFVRIHYTWVQPMFGFVHPHGFLRECVC